jgi:hypothetical protein
MSQPSPEPSLRRAWANSSLAAGLAWVVLVILPVPGTTVLGLPFGVYAFWAGLLSQRERRAAGDRTGAHRAGWGVGLSCVGFVIAVALDVFVVVVVLVGVLAAIRAAWGVHFR